MPVSYLNYDALTDGNVRTIHLSRQAQYPNLTKVILATQIVLED